MVKGDVVVSLSASLHSSSSLHSSLHHLQRFQLEEDSHDAVSSMLIGNFLFGDTENDVRV